MLLLITFKFRIFFLDFFLFQASLADGATSRFLIPYFIVFIDILTFPPGQKSRLKLLIEFCKTV